jgi:N-formylmaleamate deformylase
MLLSHGLTDNGLCWSRFAQALEADYDIVMLDARGHGESSRLADRAAYDPGRDIAEVIDKLGLKSPIVMGHSIGALATAAFAADYPHVAAKVILEDPPFLKAVDQSTGLKRQHQFRQQVAQFQTMSDDEITELGWQLSPDWHADEFPAWTLGKRQVDPEAMPVQFPRWELSIEKVHAPTLLIYGEQARGGLVTPEVAAEVRRVNPWIRAVQIPSSGHNIRRENFSDFISAVREFLNENSDNVTIGEKPLGDD